MFICMRYNPISKNEKCILIPFRMAMYLCIPVHFKPNAIQFNWISDQQATRWFARSFCQLSFTFHFHNLALHFNLNQIYFNSFRLFSTSALLPSHKSESNFNLLSSKNVRPFFFFLPFRGDICSPDTDCHIGFKLSKKKKKSYFASTNLNLHFHVMLMLNI